MLGRKPTPPYLRLLRGNPGRRAIRQTVEPELRPAPPAPPSFLSGYAAEEWSRIAPELHVLGCLTNLDVMPLAAYCEACAKWRSAVEAFDRMAIDDPVMHGLLIRRDREVAKNPLLTVTRLAAEQMLRAASEFGLAPAARSRIESGGLPLGPGKFDGLLG